MSRSRRPYGSWPSPITAADVAAAALRISQPRIDHRCVYWLEARPAEGGRQVVVRAPLNVNDAAADGAVEVTPAGGNVRTRVHEYGGGDYLPDRDRVFFVDFSDQRIYCTAHGRVVPVSQPGPRYADLVIHPEGGWLVAVEEVASDDREPENRLVAFRLPAQGGPAQPAPPRVVASGHDFYSFPCFSRDGTRLAYTAWRHPNMPWDGSELFLAEWGADGLAGTARGVAGGPTESIYQPSFSPDGVLTFVSDRSGWWNLYQLEDAGMRALCPLAAEFGRPQWVFGLSNYAFLDAGRILCAYGVGGRERLARLELGSGRLDDLALPYSGYAGVRVADGFACFVGTAVDRPAAVVLLDLASGATSERVRGAGLAADSALLSVPEQIEFPAGQGRTAHAFFYPASSSEILGMPGEKPPLLVKSHGGPTAAASDALDPRMQFWTSRGIGVVDVNYGGSTGFGREYRERLRGQWGVVDVDDCVSAALHLVREGRADEQRLAISGGSAGGYTTLCALVFRDVFSAGASHYGIGDLEALVRDTHKFESRYMDGLVGPYPERKDLFVERSPVHFPERLSCPVIFFQGLEDRVVPPNQAETMVAALAARGIRHAYVPFEGEQHGFRRAENICTALEGEFYFYAAILGFEADVAAPDAVKIVG